MNLAAVDPLYIVSGAACAGLSCLFLVSAAILIVVLLRRGRRGGSGTDADGVA
jgi:hypothetical protein